MKTNLQLRQWLSREVLGKSIPRQPPKQASILKPGPFRSWRYRQWIKSLPSAVSDQTPCDPCHTGPHPYGQKASDLTCIPLTREEHQEYDQNPKAFCDKHGLDVPAVVKRLNRLWWESYKRGA